MQINELTIIADAYRAAHCHNCQARIKDYSTYDESGDVFCTSCGEPLRMNQTEWFAMMEY